VELAKNGGTFYKLAYGVSSFAFTSEN